MSIDPTFERRRLTASEVMRMVETGVLGEDEHVELLNGELIIVSPQGPLHRGLTVRVHQALQRALGDAFHVQDHSPISAGAYNMPEPDCAVVRGPVEDYLEAHATGADLAVVVEISVTSHALDRAKASIYAAAGVGAYWQIDVPARRLVVWSSPDVARAGYAHVAMIGEDATVDLEGHAIRVADLLPPGDAEPPVS